MTKYLLAAACLALASCAAQKALTPQAEKAPPSISAAAQRKLDARHHRGQAPAPLVTDGGLRPLDSTVAIPYATPQPGRSTPFWQKLNPFRSKQPAAQPLTQQVTTPNIPRKCKGCTFNVVAGNQTVAGKKAQVAAGDGATASVIEKKAGPAQVASDSSTQNALLGGGNLAAVHGDGNQLEQKAELPPETGFPNTLDKIFGGAVAALLTGGAIWFGFPVLWPWLVGLFKRRKSSTDNGTV